jgi:hypothetical protein
MNGQSNAHGPLKVQHLNANTYVSVGLLLVLLTGFGWIIKGQGDTQNQILTAKNESTMMFDKFDTRLKSIEAAKNSWSAVDMFKWAVHLQQANPQIKVPEPEVSK